MLDLTPSQRGRPQQLNTVAEVLDAVDHTPSAGAFGPIHVVGPPAESACAVADFVHAVVGTTHRSLATAFGCREPAVAGMSTLKDSVGAVGPAESVCAVADFVHAVLGTTHRSLATTLGWRRPPVARISTLEDSVGAVGPVAGDLPQIGPRHCLPHPGNIQRILWFA